MLSGKAVSLFEETFKNLRFFSNPIESGRDSRLLCSRFSVSRLVSPPIESESTYTRKAIYKNILSLTYD